MPGLRSKFSQPLGAEYKLSAIRRSAAPYAISLWDGSIRRRRNKNSKTKPIRQKAGGPRSTKKPLTQTVGVKRKLKHVLNGSHGEFTGSDDVKNKSAKQAGLNIAKLAASMALKNQAVRKITGKGNAQKLNKAIERAITKKKAQIKGRGFYGGRGFYSGRGAYESTVSNQLVSGTSVRPATMTSSGDETGDIVVSKREYLTDIFSTGSTAFYLESFSVNPGLSGVFPFLSQIATNYTTYEFVQLIYEYVPVVSQSSTTGAMGTVILACNGNAASSPFASKVEMNEYEGAISGRVCDHLVLGVECDPRKLGISPTLYVRAGSTPAGQDIKTYDIGLYQIGLSGVSPAAFPAGTQLGEIWVHYRIKLRKPRLYDALGFNVPRDIFTHSGVGCVAALPFGTAPSKSINNIIGGRLSKAATTTYTFPDNFTGYVELNLQLQGTGLTRPTPLMVASGGVSLILDMAVSGGAASIIQLGNLGPQMTCVVHAFVALAVAPGANIVTIVLDSATTITFGTFMVVQYNPLPGYMVTSGANLTSMIPV